MLRCVGHGLDRHFAGPIRQPAIYCIVGDTMMSCCFFKWCFVLFVFAARYILANAIARFGGANFCVSCAPRRIQTYARNMLSWFCHDTYRHDFGATATGGGGGGGVFLSFFSVVCTSCFAVDEDVGRPLEGCVPAAWPPASIILPVSSCHICLQRFGMVSCHSRLLAFNLLSFFFSS